MLNVLEAYAFFLTAYTTTLGLYTESSVTGNEQKETIIQQKYNCAEDSSIDSENEICPGCACKPGYYGLKCENECPKGTYGPQCKYLCRCDKPELCDTISGHCQMEHCQEGWFSGFNCNRKKCSTLKISFEEDDVSCSHFYICFPNSPYGFKASCPQGLHWVANSGNCTYPSKARCTTEREYKPMDVVTPATFRSFQRHMKKVLSPSVCKGQVEDFPIQYQSCPTSLLRIHEIDYNARLHYERQNLAYRAHDQPIATSLYRFYKERNFGIYRHDPNHCAFFHECVYSENVDSKFLHSSWGMCPGGSIFNYDWVTCVTANHLAEGMYGSTMPEREKAEMCNLALQSADSVIDRSVMIQQQSAAIYENLNQYLSENT